MEYQDLWLDCINKLSDLAYDTSDLSEERLPVIPLIQDSLNGPIILDVMNRVNYLIRVILR